MRIWFRRVWANVLWFVKGGNPPDDFEDLDGPDGPHGRPTV